MPLSVEEFSSRLVSSGLISQPALAEFVSKLNDADRPADGEQLAKRLVKQNLLTLYQAQQVYAGKTKNLVLGNYVVVDKLGQGGMGLVLKAVHRRMDRTVALKVLSPDAVKTPGLVERFHREVKAAAKLEHPNIVTAFDADEANGTHFLVMQFVDGHDLFATVRERGPLSAGKAIESILQAARGLEFAHQHGVIHRDIKPANLLLSKDGTVKILDMGLARIDNPLGEQKLDHSLTGTGTVMGTVDYMSPEQALNTKHADAKSDQYSLGITLYFLLTGKPAYAGDTAMEKLLAHREAPLPSLGDLPSGGRQPPDSASTGDLRPPLGELNAIFQRMIAKKPADRYASMTEVIAALAALQSAQVDQPTSSFTPMSTPALPAGSTHADAALEAFLHQPLRTDAGKPTAKATGAVTLSPVSAADEPTLLGSGAVEDTATTLRRAVPTPGKPRVMRWGVLVTATCLGVGFIGLSLLALILSSANKTRVDGPLAMAKSAAETATQLARPDPQSSRWYGWPDDSPPPAIAPFTAEEAKKHQETWAAYLKVPVEWENSLGMKFRLIPPGEFVMGNTPSKIEALFEDIRKFPDDDLEKGWGDYIRSAAPQHQVILTQPFYLGVTEVTQAEFLRVTGRNLSEFASTGQRKKAVAGIDTSTFPAECVSWNDAAEFCAKLSRKENIKPRYIRDGETVVLLDGPGYRLPSEAEWEFACRAGTVTRYWIGDQEADLFRAGWFAKNSEFSTHPVGEFPANPFGLFDVHGNVWEWVQDGWDPAWYGRFDTQPALDPVRPFTDVTLRVCRGGSWWGPASVCGSSNRLANDMKARYDSFGVRVALTVDAVKQAIKNQPVGEPAETLTLSNQADADRLKSGEYVWSEPEDLRLDVDPLGLYVLCGVSPDELTVYVWQSGNGLFAFRRPAIGQPFAKPQYLGFQADTCNSVSANGLLAAGYRDTEGQSFQREIWLSARTSIEEPFPKPVILPAPVNHSADDLRPILSADGKTLLFSSTRDSSRSADVWLATRNSVEEPFGEPEQLPVPVNTISWDMPYWISDSRTEFLVSRQYIIENPTRTAREFWYFTRATPAGLFRPGTRIELPLNPVEAIDTTEGFLLSADRQQLYFSTSMRLGPAKSDMWVSRLQRKAAPPANAGWHGWPADAPKPAIAPFDAAQAKSHQEEWAAYLKVPVEYTNSLGMKFRLIPPGEFLMGSTPQQIEKTLPFAAAIPEWKEFAQSEGPQHRVILTQPFYLGTHEVTQQDYAAVTGTSPSFFSSTGQGASYVTGVETSRFPVEMVNWIDAGAFCEKLSRSDTSLRQAEMTYRLPTEAEWEFACRAGTTTAFWNADADESLAEIAWYGKNSGTRPHPTGELQANPFGLFDTSGNVREWVQDEWSPTFYAKFQDRPAIDPIAPYVNGTQRVFRGGDFDDVHSGSASSSGRYAFVLSRADYAVGIRPALSIDAVKQALPQAIIRPQVNLAAHRAALDWVRGAEGTLEVQVGDKHVTINPQTPYPAQTFELLSINLTRAVIPDPEKLKPLAALPPGFDVALPEVYTEAKSAQALSHLRNADMAIVMNVNRTVTRRFGESLGDHPIRYLVFLKQELKPGSLAALKNLPKLELLLLKGCAVSPEVLREVEELPRLAMLNLESSTLTGAHLKALTLPKLIGLSVWGTAVTAADLVEFQRRNPRVGIDGISHLQEEFDRLKQNSAHGWPADAPPPAKAPFDAAQAKQHQEAWAAYLKVPVEWENSIGMKFRLIPPGEYTIGLTAEQEAEILPLLESKGGFRDHFLRQAKPAHRVSLTRPFYLLREDVNAGWYQTLMGALPKDAAVARPEDPVLKDVSWHKAIEFCNRLSAREDWKPAYEIEGTAVRWSNADSGARLPTEAEWEYACRAGTETLFFFGNGTGDYAARSKQLLSHQRWLHNPAAPANPFGLFDLYAGADEWCWDHVVDGGFPQSLISQRSDPVQTTGTYRVKRGGSSFSDSGGDLLLVTSYFRYIIHSDPDGEYNYSGFGRVVVPVDSVRQSLKTTGPALPKPSSADVANADRRTALNFDSPSARVELPLLDDRNGPWTLEAWVRPADKLNKMATIIAAFRAPRGMGLSLFEEQLEAAISMADQPTWATAKTGKRLDPTRFHHVAAVYLAPRLTVFLNGEPVGQANAGEDHAPAAARFCIGGYNDGDSFSGLIDEVRISNSARYTEKFKAPRRFEPDADTLALYHFDEGDGEELKDASGKNHHGKILGAKWTTAAAPMSDQSTRLQFEKLGRVELPLQLPASAPLTCEVEIAPRPANPDATHYPIFALSKGNDLKQHLGGYVWTCGFGQTVHTKAKLVETPKVLLAATTSRTSARLFVNGKKIEEVSTATAGTSDELRPMFLGRPLGAPKADWSAYDGGIYRFRLSEGERYAADYDPTGEWTPDDQTLVLYDFRRGSGSEVQDLSGRNHHGKLSGAMWERIAAVEFDPQQRLAEWLRSNGHSFSINEQRDEIDGLPPGAFKIRIVTLSLISDAQAMEFANLAEPLKSIELLSYSNSPKLTVEGLRQLLRIKTVNLFGGPLSEVHGFEARQLAELPQLRHLMLGHSQRTTDRTIGTLKVLPELISLNISFCPVKGESLSQLRELQKLETLNLISLKLTDEVWGQLENFPRLSLLNVGNNGSLVGKGISKLRNTPVQSLSLFNTSFADESLAEIPPISTLTSLDLIGCPVTDAGLPNLAGSSITQINLQKTKVTEQGVKKLAELLPKCHIHWDKGEIPAAKSGVPPKN